LKQLINRLRDGLQLPVVVTVFTFSAF